MGLTCKPIGKWKSFLKKIDNELARQAAALKPTKKKKENQEPQKN